MLPLLPEPLAAAFANNNGRLTFGHYMALSNQHYYAQSNVIGQTGDFITAPEISQLFGEMLGIWVVQQWHNLGQPAQWQLIELGPGRGTLMADALRVILKFIPSESIQLFAVETSPELRRQQAKAWSPYHLSPQWTDNIAAIPTGISITLANEFLDALPVEQYKWDGQQWLQLYVMQKNSILHLQANPPLAGGSKTAQLFSGWGKINHKFPPHPDPLTRIDPPARGGFTSIYESSALRHQALAPLAAKLKEQRGAALFIDYGFAEHAFGNTLQAVKNHQPVDILAYPGAADLTSHVNFAALKTWAIAQNLCPSKIITQADLLHALGIAERLKLLQTKADMPTNLELLNGYQRLTAPSQMGTLFKAIELHAPSLAECSK